MKKIKLNYDFILISLFISIICVIPYFLMGGISAEHDTFFHLSRIEGYSQSILNFDFLPKIYPFKNGGFGYGSPIFYSDILLLPFSLIYILTDSIVFSYVSLLIVFSFLSAYFTCTLIDKISNNKYLAYFGAFIYIFSTYRLTDIYVRGAIGEVMALAFLPLVLLGIYYLFYQIKPKKAIYYLTIGMTFLILTHNITFFLCFLLIIFFMIINHQKLIQHKKYFIILVISGILTALFSAFYIFGMLEQLSSHEMIVHYYGGSSDLISHALDFDQLFRNDFVFGFSSTNDNISKMVLTPGLALLLLPLIYFFEKNKNSFVLHSMILGYICVLLSTNITPWFLLDYLGVIQFPWRFMTLATILLVIPSCYALNKLFKFNKIIFATTLTLVIFNTGYLLTKIEDRPFPLPFELKYESLLDGTLIDPYYSATYMRVELAGGDYLPWPSIDYRNIDQCALDDSLSNISCDVEKEYTTTTISIANNHNDSFLLPLTYYEGYEAYIIDEDNNKQFVAITQDYNTGLVRVHDITLDNFTIIVEYKGTFIQILGIITTLIAILSSLFVIYCSKNTLHKIYRMLD